jgi:purine catabolism regulator
MVSDRQLLAEFEEEYLKALEDYDAAHDSDYVRTLEYYLKYNGSIRQVADAMFIHRNTISYRMNHIREITGCPLDTEEERLCCLTACMIRHMRQAAP